MTQSTMPKPFSIGAYAEGVVYRDPPASRRLSIPAAVPARPLLCRAAEQWIAHNHAAAPDRGGGIVGAPAALDG